MKSLPNLYPLRFLLAVIVVLFHIPHISQTLGLPFYDNLPIFHKGELAVYYFFSLSGFLILRMMYLEIQSTGTINIPKFYMRRIRRLYPVYYLVFFTGVFLYHLLLPLLHIPFEITYPINKLVAGYVFLIPNVLKYYYPDIGGILIVLWSIGVEEQFYLFIPLFLWVVRKNAFWSIILLLCVLLLLLAFIPGFYRYYNYYFYFLSGGLASILYIKIKLSALRSKYLHAFIYLCFVLSFASNLLEFHPAFLYHFFNMIVSSCLLTLLSDYPLFEIKNKLINYLGKISYGIYMYHMIIITGVLFVVTKWKSLAGMETISFVFLLNVSVLLLTLLTAHISYKYFESYFYKSKP